MPSAAGDPLRLESKLSREEAGALLVFFRWKKRRRRCSALVVSCGGGGGGREAAEAAAEALDLGIVVPGDPDAVEPLDSTSCWRSMDAYQKKEDRLRELA